MNEEEVLVIGIIVLFLITMIYLIYKSSKNETEDQTEEKQLSDWEIEEASVEIGKWEEEVRQKMSSIVKIKNKYSTNRTVNILVGDYNKMSVSNTVTVLESMGLKVSIAKSGVEIIKRIKSGEKYDAIISNNIYDSGHLDGPQTLSILKDMEEFDTPIIVLTVSENQRHLFIQDYGFDEYMTKLLDQDKVLETLPKVIKNLKFIKKQNKSNKS